MAPSFPARRSSELHIAAVGGFAQLVTAEAELLVNAARAAGERAAIALPALAGITRQLLQRNDSLFLFFVGRGHAGDRLLQRRTLLRITGSERGALLLALDHFGLVLRSLLPRSEQHTSELLS